AKATAAGFGVPLLRLDVGALYNKYHGETEANLRQALASIDLPQPCTPSSSMPRGGSSPAGAEPAMNATRRWLIQRL
ncbi:hypothetical protein, partial [Escherichia coli]|uniref:hypothetical protein n=1 Tax=Escherichia coli TaxID=562 RepID=UPI003B9EB166